VEGSDFRARRDLPYYYFWLAADRPKRPVDVSRIEVCIRPVADGQVLGKLTLNVGRNGHRGVAEGTLNAQHLGFPLTGLLCINDAQNEDGCTNCVRDSLHPERAPCDWAAVLRHEGVECTSILDLSRGVPIVEQL